VYVTIDKLLLYLCGIASEDVAEILFKFFLHKTIA
jgi:hypothetical protein